MVGREADMNKKKWEHTNKQKNIAYQINTKGFNKEGQKADKRYFYIKSSRSIN